MAKTKKEQKNVIHYPPVVAVVGHVDHGKTTLLDTFRKTNIADREHGGITQRIGASAIEIEHEGEKRKITFIDTPGHEAFSLMRGRGVQAADIALLVVSSVDGVMPQTKESIKLLKDSKLPFIVVLTKSDSPEKNPEKAKQQLIKEEVLLEGYGGDVPVIEVSAKTNSNIKELLELILLVFDVKKSSGFYKNSPENLFEAVVIESKLDQKAGPRATIVIKNGKLSLRDEIYSEDTRARVKTLINDRGEHLNLAQIGDAVEVLGFEKVPKVGSVVMNKKEEPKVSEEEVVLQKTMELEAADENILSLVLRADTLGSLEAIIYSLPPKIKVVSQKTGDVDTSDVLFAKSVGAIILGFNIKIRPEVIKLAGTEKVLMKNYTIIYEMLDEISDFLEGNRLALLEKVFGEAKILASFPFDKVKVLGIAVTEGRIARGDKVRLMRKEEIMGESSINSVRQGKEQISKIEKGQEGGIILSPSLDFTIGDVLISHA